VGIDVARRPPVAALIPPYSPPTPGVPDRAAALHRLSLLRTGSAFYAPLSLDAPPTCVILQPEAYRRWSLYHRPIEDRRLSATSAIMSPPPTPQESAQPSNTQIYQDGSHFSGTHVLGGYVFQGNFIGLTVRKCSLVLLDIASMLTTHRPRGGRQAQEDLQLALCA
jgi:hypothetical protein